MKTLIAIPVFNEARTLQPVLAAVRRYGHDILVVDDGSTDATPDLLNSARGIATITHPENRGYGQSLIDAFAFADHNGYDWVLTMDCDEQHEPAHIPCFLARARRDDLDIVSGSRYLRVDATDDDAPADRQRINATVRDLLEQVLDLRLTDAFCGFKAHRVAALRSLTLDEAGYAFPLQFWVQCVRAGLRIGEIPVRRIYRDAARSFGAALDDPTARLQHYLGVFVDELRRESLVTCTAQDLARCLKTA